MSDLVPLYKKVLGTIESKVLLDMREEIEELQKALARERALRRCLQARVELVVNEKVLDLKRG